MLADLQPDRSITGGAFYEGERFDKELVEVIASFLYIPGIILVFRESAKY